MSDTMITWWERDQRSEGREDSTWYMDDSTHSLVCSLKLYAREVDIYVDGRMLATLDNGITVKNGFDLMENGIGSDAEIFDANENGRLWWENNSWFDLYLDRGDQTEWTGTVCHSLTDAIQEAIAMLNRDDLWIAEEA